jgi:hypothetical protein
VNSLQCYVIIINRIFINFTAWKDLGTGEGIRKGEEGLGREIGQEWRIE